MNDKMFSFITGMVVATFIVVMVTAGAYFGYVISPLVPVREAYTVAVTTVLNGFFATTMMVMFVGELKRASPMAERMERLP